MNRRLVAAALVALLALLSLTLVGCGGGGEETPPPAEEAAVPPPPSSTPVDGVAIADRSVEETDVFEPFPTGDYVPAEITERLSTTPRQPMLLFFTDDAQQETDDARAEVIKVRDDNAGAIDLIEYNVGKYTSVDDSGVASVDTKLDNDEKAKQAVTLARELGVKFTPFGVVVDDQGYIIFKWRGYISAEMLGRQVDRVKD